MIKLFYSYIFFILISCATLSLYSCISLKKQRNANKSKELINKNLLTYDDCKSQYEELIKKIDIKNGDVIADVGASIGIDDFALSVLTDSVSYFIQDISSETLNKDILIDMQNYYNSLRKSPQTNKFQFVIGNERKSCLPDSSFNLIFLFNSLHEFTYVKEMIDDLSKKLKHNGKLIVRESLSTNSKKHIISGCFTTAYTKDEVVCLMKRSGLYIEQQLFPDSNLVNIFIFGKKSQ